MVMGKNSYIKVTQIASSIGRPKIQRETLKGLGLNKINRTRNIIDTPATRGMIKKIRHLIKYDEVK